MNKDYEEGYGAGRNNWAYDLTKANNSDYNAGWRDGVKALYQWDVMNNW